MMRSPHADDPDAVRLRKAIAAELVGLRRAFIPWTGRAASGKSLTGQATNIIQANPALAAGALAGALAGIVTALRRRVRSREAR